MTEEKLATVCITIVVILVVLCCYSCQMKSNINCSLDLDKERQKVAMYEQIFRDANIVAPCGERKAKVVEAE